MASNNPVPPYKQNAAAAPNAVPQAPQPTGVKEEFHKIAADIRTIAAKLPTPGVTDSKLHHDKLNKLSDRIKALAEKL